VTKYKINVNVEFIECDDSVNNEPLKQGNGNFAVTISEQDAISIDKCESSVLNTAYPAIRDAISKHLGDVSKKKLTKSTTFKEK